MIEVVRSSTVVAVCVLELAKVVQSVNLLQSDLKRCDGALEREHGTMFKQDVRHSAPSSTSGFGSYPVLVLARLQYSQ